MLMSHSARSAWLTGRPRCGDSARAAPAASASMQAAMARSRMDVLRVDMAHLALAIDRPARDRIVVVAREAAHRGRLGGLSAPGDELLARGLRVSALVPGTALQDRGSAVPAPRHAEAGEGFRQPRLVERSFRPALAAVGRHEDLCDPPVARIGDAGDLVDTGLPELEAGRRRGDERLHLLH